MTYEQKRNHIIAILTAEREGKAIEYSPAFDMDWTQVSRLDWAHLAKHPERYRIKAEPKLRPWKPEEVPVGAMIRQKRLQDLVMLIVCAWPGGLRAQDNSAQGHQLSFEAALDNYEYCVDAQNWKPCGVEK